MTTPPLQSFEQWVEQCPAAVALRWKDKTLSYADLEHRANQVANALIQVGCQPGAVVALATPRSDEAVIGMLGILKAGAAYVPLDPLYPEAWRNRIISQCSPQACVGVDATLAERGLPCVGTSEDCLKDFDSTRPALTPDPDALMYVIFTSGTTGFPKGVMVSHANVARLFPALREHITFGQEDTWTLFHSYAFGFSVWEIWGALLHGGTLVVVPPNITGHPGFLLELLEREGVSVLSQTPTAFRGLTRWITDHAVAEQLQRLRVVAFSGEPVEQHVINRWTQRFGEDQPLLINMYAATETSGEVSFQRLLGATEKTGLGEGTAIGVPLADSALHVLDSWMRPMPDGETGELYVGGPGVAHGYWGDPAETEARFVDSPPALGEGRLYRSGDLAFRNDDGGLVLVGRSDQQVKIAGYRIDTGGIESEMLGFETISDAIAVPELTVGGDTRLVAYLIVKRGETLQHEDLRLYLAASLPAYAVPSKFVELRSFPLSDNGKLDRVGLRSLADRKQNSAPELDRSKVEEVVTNIWKSLLGTSHIEATDDFFEMGGHSLLTLSLVTQIDEQLGIYINMADVFEHPRLDQFVSWLEQDRQSSHVQTELDNSEHMVFMELAIDKAREAMSVGQPPYAACIVRDNKVIACVHNCIWDGPDATAHAEVEAIRHACRDLGKVALADCTIYSTCEPCCLCTSAIHWAEINTIVYAVSMEDEQRYGLSDPTIPCSSMVEQLGRPVDVLAGVGRSRMQAVFEDWLKIQSLAI